MQYIIQDMYQKCKIGSSFYEPEEIICKCCKHCKLYISAVNTVNKVQMY